MGAPAATAQEQAPTELTGGHRNAGADTVSVGPPNRARRHWGRLAAALVVAGVLGAFLAVWVPYEFRTRPGARTIGSALSTFRTASTLPRQAAAGLPAPSTGVYRLAGQGSEQISFPPNTQKDGAVMPASVTSLANGCWRWRVDYNVAHWEEYDFCPTATALLQVANRNSQTWDFGSTTIKNLAQYSCDPPQVLLPAHPVAGQMFSPSCTGSNSAIPGVSRTSGQIRIVGTEPLVIGGVTTQTVHESQRTSVSGGQKGDITEDWWLVAKTGLPVRMTRHIVVGSPSPIGTITYNEDGWWQMASLQPQT